MIKKKIIIGVVALGVIGVFASAGWTARWKFWEKKVKTETKKTQTEIQLKTEDKSDRVATSTQNQIDTSDWNIYKNEKYEFEIKYPPYSPKVKKTYDQATKKWIGKEISIPQIRESEEKDSVEILLPFPQETLARERKVEITIEKISREDFKECSEARDLGLIGPKEPEIVYIGGIKFKKIEVDDNGMGESIRYTRYSTLRENQCLSITFTSTIRTMFPASEASFFEKQMRELTREENKIQEQMLSTFRFTK